MKAVVGIVAAAVLMGANVPENSGNASKAKVEEARALLAVGNDKDAISRFREAVALDQRNAVAHNALGSLLNSSGHYAEALRHAQRAVDLEPGNARYRYNRGVVLAEHGRFPEAIADFDIALAAYPDLTYAWLERGAAKMSLNDRDGAWRDWEAAERADPKLIWTRWYRATGDFLEGRFTEAAKGFDQVAKAEPGFVPAKIWQAVAHGRVGDRFQPSQSNSGDWPAPILQHYLGTITADELLGRASDDKISGDQRRVGEAHYFLAQHAMSRADLGAAVDHLRRALATKSPRHVWRMAAERDLKQLQARD